MMIFTKKFPKLGSVNTHILDSKSVLAKGYPNNNTPRYSLITIIKQQIKVI